MSNTTETKLFGKNTLDKINLGTEMKLRVDVDFKHIDDTYVGAIIFHMPSEFENIKIGVLKADLLGGYDVDAVTHNRAHMVSVFSIAIDEAPDWFTMDNPRLAYDDFVRVFTAFDEWESDFRTPNTERELGKVSSNFNSSVPVVDTEDI